MEIRRHANATTKQQRAHIQCSSRPAAELAVELGVSETTIRAAGEPETRSRTARTHRTGWQQRGVWVELQAHVMREPDLQHPLIDSTVVRAHPRAAGAGRGGAEFRRGSSLGPFAGWSWHQDSCRDRCLG